MEKIYKELPRKKYIQIEGNNIRYTLLTNNIINIFLKDDNNLNYTEILSVLSKYPGCEVRIWDITSRNALNSVILTLSKYYYDGKVNLYISSVDKNNNMKNLDNNMVIKIEQLPGYAKIHGFPMDNKQSEFTTWAHRLNDKDKKTLMNVLSDDDKEAFETQESIMYTLHRDILKAYPNIMQLRPITRFEIIFDYISKRFPYAHECLNAEGNGVTQGNSWSQDAVETYRHGRGVCAGRSNLLTLVANNNLFDIKCTTASGDLVTDKRVRPHAWNQFIDDNGNITNYDLSFAAIIRGYTTSELENQGYVFDRVYTCVKELEENRSNHHIVPPLPKRKVKQLPPPLPPRRSEGE